jgi:hypothetical protein
MSERNFNNFEFGDDVYELAGGLVPELAERAGLDPYAGNRSDVMGELVGVLGKNKVLRDNEPIDFLTISEMASYVTRSAVLQPLNRSLWLPDKQVPEGTPRVITGGVANWQDRVAKFLVNKAKSLTSDVTVYIPVGNRVMNGPTEVINKNVQQFVEQYKTEPTEGNYAVEFVVPKLTEAGYTTWVYYNETTAGDEIATSFVEGSPELFMPGEKLSFVKVAGAGLQLALQFRNAAKEIHKRYDGIKYKPQVFVETDAIKVARTSDQVKRALDYQAPQPGLRQAALTAKLLHLAAGYR